MIAPAVVELAVLTSIAMACALLGRSRASHYRAQKEIERRAGLPFGPEPRHEQPPRPTPPNALSAAERDRVLGVLTEPRFADKAVAQTWAVLLDEGTYLCSMSTMHRILRTHDLAGERRRQATHPPRKKPELLATRPGQVWSWDITKLRGPTRGVYYDLYVVIDIYSRYIVAWTIAAREDSEIAKTMLEHAMGMHGIPDAVHADRGTSMTSKPVAQLLLDLGVDRSHSRPHVSNDNPYSEAAFKTAESIGERNGPVTLRSHSTRERSDGRDPHARAEAVGVPSPCSRLAPRGHLTRDRLQRADGGPDGPGRAVHHGR